MQNRFTMSEMKQFYQDQGTPITSHKSNATGRYYVIDGCSYTRQSLEAKYAREKS